MNDDRCPTCGASTTDRAAQLREQRSRLSARLADPDTPGSACAAISRELRALDDVLATTGPRSTTPLDQLRAKRNARREQTPRSGGLRR